MPGAPFMHRFVVADPTRSRPVVCVPPFASFRVHSVRAPGAGTLLVDGERAEQCGQVLVLLHAR